MRSLVVVGVMIVLAGCGPTPPAAAPAAPTDAAPTPAADPALPAGFPQTDLAARGAECAVYLGLTIQANATPAGRDAPIMQQAADQWRASLEIDGGLSETEVQQLVASSVNPLMATPASQRDAAAAWCVDNAPEPDPAR